MSGYSIWGHDVGGYQNRDFSPVSRSNLFMRWTQFGCFSPILQMRRQVKKDQNDPASTPFGQYPWCYGRDAEENFRFYARLHTRLFPYIYTYAKEASESKSPIIRPSSCCTRMTPGLTSSVTPIFSAMNSSWRR
jgi:alpha-glucosidase (family GH31 glycosyl hydrolase)